MSLSDDSRSEVSLWRVFFADCDVGSVLRQSKRYIFVIRIGLVDLSAAESADIP
jgi:hypothetical protein